MFLLVGRVVGSAKPEHPEWCALADLNQVLQGLDAGELRARDHLIPSPPLRLLQRLNAFFDRRYLDDVRCSSRRAATWLASSGDISPVATAVMIAPIAPTTSLAPAIGGRLNSSVRPFGYWPNPFQNDVGAPSVSLQRRLDDRAEDFIGTAFSDAIQAGSDSVAATLWPPWVAGAETSSAVAMTLVHPMSFRSIRAGAHHSTTIPGVVLGQHIHLWFGLGANPHIFDVPSLDDLRHRDRPLVANCTANVARLDQARGPIVGQCCRAIPVRCAPLADEVIEADIGVVVEPIVRKSGDTVERQDGAAVVAMDNAAGLQSPIC